MESTHAGEVERWRAGRMATLTGPDGWLSLVALVWLPQGNTTLGSGPSNDAVFPKGPTRAGTIRVEGLAATGRFLDGAGVTHHGRPVTVIPMQDDSTGTPTVLSLDTVRFHVIRREGRLALRVRDRDHPARRSFTGIEHWPVDPRWRIEGSFDAYDPVRHVKVPTVLGHEETYPVPGAVVFRMAGRPLRLDVFQEPGQTDLFVVFADETTGTETFGGGRYLYARPPDLDGVVVLDFNRAYNPPCVFTPHATCPLPLPQNRLPVRVEAGEQRYAGRAPDGSRMTQGLRPTRTWVRGYSTEFTNEGGTTT